MRALRLNAWKSTPELVDVPEPVAGPGQAVIRIGGAGACHSDLHMMHDYQEGDLGWNPPFILGHENAGWVHSVGAGVQRLSPGQPVAVHGPWGCGGCDACLVGSDNYCEDLAHAPVPGGGGGCGIDGGMAEFMLVPDARWLVPLPEDLDPVLAAPLTDAGLTPYHAIKPSWSKLGPRSNAVVIGVGGLGHMGVQVLNATTSARIIAVDTRPEPLELARACGADETVLVGPESVAEIRDLMGNRGAELVIDFVGSNASLQLAAPLAQHGGDFTIVGLGGGTLALDFFSVAFNVSVRTSYWGTRPELREVLALGARGLISPKVTTFALEDALQAYAQMENGTLEGRAVIVP